tara:strand:- start:21242 stop:21484 length:243 start_codon:yes stop_codon:yes gene_type:complete
MKNKKIIIETVLSNTDINLYRAICPKGVFEIHEVCKTFRESDNIDVYETYDNGRRGELKVRANSMEEVMQWLNTPSVNLS